jgi:hypothetical protein
VEVASRLASEIVKQEHHFPLPFEEYARGSQEGRYTGFEWNIMMSLNKLHSEKW